MSMSIRLWEEITGAIRPGEVFRAGALVDRCPSIAHKTTRRQVELITEVLQGVLTEYNNRPERFDGIAPCSRPSARTWKL